MDIFQHKHYTCTCTVHIIDIDMMDIIDITQTELETCVSVDGILSLWLSRDVRKYSDKSEILSSQVRRARIHVWPNVVFHTVWHKGGGSLWACMMYSCLVSEGWIWLKPDPLTHLSTLVSFPTPSLHPQMQIHVKKKKKTVASAFLLLYYYQ